MVPNKGQIWLPLQEGKTFVCPEHEEKFRKFNDYSRRHGRLFMILMGVSFLTMCVSAVASDLWHGNNNYQLGYVFIGSFASMGIVLFIFPFCSQGNIQSFSIAVSIKLVRIVSVVIIALGVIGLIFALLDG